MTAPTPSAIERRPFLKLTAGALAAATAGCRRNLDRAYSRPDTLIAGVSIYEKGALNPDELPSTLVFLPLVRNNRGERQPCLALSWQHSPDFLEWTYQLRPGVRWHDGRPVTAYDVKATLDAWGADMGMGAPDACTVHDASTVTVRGIKWAKESPDEVLGILPGHLVGQLDPRHIYEWDFWLRPVGCGPYRLLRRQASSMVELEANPDYFLGSPAIHRVVLKLTSGSGLTELLSGNVDTIKLETTADLPSIAHDARFRTYSSQSAGIGKLLSVVWNNDNPLFQEAAIRRALSLAINRRELAQLLYLPPQSARVDGLYTMRQLRRGEATEPRFDMAEAGRLLDESGWRRNGNGWRERNGAPFEFIAFVQPGMTVAAIYVQAQFRKLGVRMEVPPMDLGNLRNRLRARDFAAAICRPASIWGHLNGLRRQSTGYRNPGLEALLDQEDAAVDRDSLDQLYRAISDLVRADQPITFLTRLTPTYVAHHRVLGLSSPGHDNPLTYTEELSLDDGRH
jgi:peptide/nickel transport system substrate-binding protein